MPSHLLSFKIDFNIILSSASKSLMSSHSFTFSHHALYAIALCPIVFSTWPVHVIVLDLVTPVYRYIRVWIMQYFIIKCSSVACFFLPLRPKYIPQHPVLKYKACFLALMLETKIQTLIELWAKLQFPLPQFVWF
jgi:hypothetical protein